MSKPRMYIIAGPNGSGKTTFAVDYLPQMVTCDTFINADLIAYGMSPLAPERALLAASKIFLGEIRKCLQRRQTFAFETTLAGRSYAKLIEESVADGWEVTLFYLWVPSVEFSAQRVEERVRQGGHDIPMADILRRFPRSISNLFELFLPLCAKALCYENSGQSPVPIFENDANGLEIFDHVNYERMRTISDGFTRNTRNG